tara:strand:+ start:1946 stop:2284 length:339 start_codon:yes stop_codon:yes gene_type:complete
MSLTDSEKNRLKKVGLKGLNKPKMTPSHKSKKAVVAVRDGSKVKVIRFGAKGMGHNYSPEARKSFKARHGKNIKKVRHQQHTGRTRYSGVVQVQERNLLRSLRSIGSVNVYR